MFIVKNYSIKSYNLPYRPITFHNVKTVKREGRFTKQIVKETMFPYMSIKESVFGFLKIIDSVVNHAAT